MIINYKFRGKFRLPASGEQFDLYASMANLTHVITRLYAFSFFFLFFYIISVLYIKIPHLAVLFISIAKSIDFLMIIGLMSILILLGFSLAAIQLFGWNSIQYNSLPTALMQLFKAGIGLEVYSEMENSNSEMASAFYIIYMIIFYMILSKLAVGVIIGIYYSVSEKLDPEVAASNLLMNEEYDKYIKKVYDWFTCTDSIRKTPGDCGQTC